MAEAVHVFERLVEVEPLGPGVEVATAALPAVIAVTALVVDVGLGEILAFAQLVENRSGPPMEMRVDDVHGALLPDGVRI